MRSLRHLEEEAALRHPNPDQPSSDPVCSALCGAGVERLAALSGVTAAWLRARDQWVDTTIRRQILPGHAQALILGLGLDPRLSRLPAGLLGEGAVLVVDRSDVLAARQRRLRGRGLEEPLQLTYLVGDPHAPAQLDTLLQGYVGGERASWLVMGVGLASWWGLDGLSQAVEALRSLGEPQGSLGIGVDWLGPGLEAAPEGVQAGLVPRFGAPLALAPLGLELWFKAMGAVEVETTTLLRYGDEGVGFGTWAQW
ncbi:MAG: hypothetical protein CMH57_14020 [Myxococcales bacterium]|nr:hypothetical protein [Myxococcales bacterium]